MALLNDAEIQKHLATLKGWTRDDNAIKKQFVFSGFRSSGIRAAARTRLRGGRSPS